MIVIKLAWRNIFRHRRRSLVTMLTICTGIVGIVMFGGFAKANYTGLRESVIRSQYGHLQIYAKGYIENHRRLPDKYRLDDKQIKTLTSRLADNNEVFAAGKRLEFTGLLGNDMQSQAVVIRGVEPDQEALINSALTIIKGDDLNEGDAEGVLLGEGLAAALSIDPGGHLTLLGTTVDGVMNAVDVKIQGVFRSFAKEYDDRAMIMNLQYAQKLLNTDKVDKIVVLISNTSGLQEFIRTTTASIEEFNLRFEYRSWEDLATFYHKVVDLYDGFFAFISFVIFTVVLFSITNTMMITVLERTSEIGTLRALGTNRPGIVRQFLTEGVMLSMIGCLAGVAAGALLSYYITSLGIMMPAPPGSSRGFPLRIEYVPMVWAQSILVVFIVAILASWYPAAKASNKEIVDAIRYV